MDYVLIPNLPTTSPTASVSGVPTQGVIAMGNVDVAAYQRAFLHAGVIQATLSGLVDGQMDSGSVEDGGKLVPIMPGLAYETFTVLTTVTAP